MATHAPRDADTGTVDLSPALPTELQALTRLSWELGFRVVEDDDSTRHSEWAHTETRRQLSLFEATSNTVVIRVRTPVGRQRFYGTTKSGLESALSCLDDDPDWRRLSRGPA